MEKCEIVAVWHTVLDASKGLGMAYTFQSLRENSSMANAKLNVPSCFRLSHIFYINISIFNFILSHYFTKFRLQISKFFFLFTKKIIIPQLSVIIFISPNLLTEIFRVSGSSDLPRPVQTVFFLFRQVTAVAKECQLA